MWFSLCCDINKMKFELAKYTGNATNQISETRIVYDSKKSEIVGQKLKGYDFSIKFAVHYPRYAFHYNTLLHTTLNWQSAVDNISCSGSAMSTLVVGILFKIVFRALQKPSHISEKITFICHHALSSPSSVFFPIHISIDWDVILTLLIWSKCFSALLTHCGLGMQVSVSVQDHP